MSRPFPTTFDKDGQPNSQSGGTTPISYQANVNRQKTKKWVDAKAANYGGDDWGSDDDDYGYEEPPPPPVASKATGYRGQAQTLQSPQQSNSPAADNYKKSYGDLPSRPRANSFDADDESRNFSSTTYGLNPSQTRADNEAPTTQFPQNTGIPSTSQSSGPPLSVNTQGVHDVQGQEQRQAAQRLSSQAASIPESRFSSGDYQAKRDFSPSAAPPPLNTLASSPSGTSPYSSRFPARKSSLSQSTGPNLQDRDRTSQDVKPPQTATSPNTTPAKALPFIRPADIYRRAEEERRQSVESNNRPNVETILGSRSGDRSDSPGKPVLNDNSASDSFGGQGRPTAKRDESPGGRHLAPTLEPVQERKSEYGFDGFNVAAQNSRDTTASDPQLSQPPPASVRADAQDARIQSTSPQLPNLNRMSGFGVDMFLGPSNTSVPSTSLEQQTQPVELPQSSITTVSDTTDRNKYSVVAGPSQLVQPKISDTQVGQNPTNLHGKDSSTMYHSLDDEEPLQPPRSLVHAPSAQSFRPDLPGGWTSYTTIPQVETPQAEPTTHWSSIDSERIEVEDNSDLTPTTTRHQLPQTQSTADIADFQTGAPRGEHDEDKTLPPPPHSQAAFTAESMPTPDPSMAPSGNLYAATTVDPRLLPKLERAPEETQLRPLVNESTKFPPSPDVPPPPPAKDTPEVMKSIEPDGYFPTTGQSSTFGKSLGSKSVSRQTSSVSQQIESSNDENDRLEEEIVRRLSPQPREESRDGLLTPGSPNNARESTYLPAEYGDYWASAPPDAQTPPLRHGHDDQSNQVANAVPSTIRGVDLPDESVAPLSVAKSERHTDLATSMDRPAVKQRFSWEQSSENVSSANLIQQRGDDTRPPPPAMPVDPPAFQAAPPPPPASLDNRSEYDAAPTPQYDLLPPPPQADEKIAVLPDSASINRGSFEDSRSIDKTTALGGAAALTAGLATAAVVTQAVDNKPQRRASLAEEKATRVSSYPVNVTPPENEHPARSPEPYFGTGGEHVQQQPLSSAASPISSPTFPLPPNTTSRLLAFKEIMNLKTSHQRIQTFDETRHRFAAMDSGLSNWMETLRAQHPEHSNANGLWSTSGPGVPSKNSKNSGLQQPYYQQYLNASSPTNVSATNSLPISTSPSNQQGSHSGPSKITTQQVQAKGKELLHTAGIFGGKAGKAGKGLLAKGKSRFRGTGGDKVSPERPSQESRPKNENRKSWGLPLSRPKSISISEKSINASKDNLTAPKIQDDTPKSSLMTSVSSQPPILPRTATSGTFDNIDLPGAWPVTPAPATDVGQSRTQNELVASVREIADADHSTTESDLQEDLEERDRLDDDLAPPRPIGKHQPSWDPFNATPIAEEQGSSYETRPEQKAYPFPASMGSTTDYAEHHESRSGAYPIRVSDNSSSLHDIARQNFLVDEINARESQGPHLAQNSPLVVAPSSGESVISDQSTPRDLGENNAKDTISGTHTRHDTQHLSLKTPEPVISSSQHDSVHQAESRPLVANLENEDRQQDSSFLPPVRRTSAFSFKFGSRRAKERFPIDDDDEDVTASNVVTGVNNPVVADTSSSTTTRAHPKTQDIVDATSAPLRHERRSLQQLRLEDSGYSPDQLNHSLQGNTSEQLHVPTRLLGSEETISARKQSLDELDQSRQTGSRRQSSDTARPPLVQASSSEYSQRSAGSHGSGPQTPVARVYDNTAQPAVSRKSQDAWRPNAVSTGVSSPPPQDLPAPSFAPRQSWENQRPRGASGSSFNLGARPEPPAERQWSPAPARPFEQPPSAAQRYPNLFKSAVQNQEPIERENVDLPAHYYQQPLPREAAFLPRQQTNEYQLPGVGPDEYRKRPRRNSSLLRDLGGRISRATSRERQPSISQDDDPRITRSRKDSRVDDDADSSIMSEETIEKKKRRSSFFRGISRSSTGTPDAHRSNDGVATQSLTSRRDLQDNQTPSSPRINPDGPSESRTSVSNAGLVDKRHTPNKLSKSSTTSTPEPISTKKKRFSGLSGFFGAKSNSRNVTPTGPQTTRELSQGERQPLETPQVSRVSSQIQGPPQNYRPSQSQEQAYPSAYQHQQTPPTDKSNGVGVNQNIRPGEGPRAAFGKPQAIVAGAFQQDPRRSFSQPMPQDSKPRKSSRTRRSSGAGLFGGILGRKQSSQEEKSREVASNNNQGAYASPARSQSTLQDAITPTQLTGRSTSQDPSPRFDSPSQPIPDNRGRPITREPQYDSVPIPGGYSLVRAQAGQPAHTDYNPRAPRFENSGPHHSQARQIIAPTQSPSQAQQPFERFAPQAAAREAPNISIQTQNLGREQGATHISSHQSPSTRVSRPLSPDDIAARSPALAPKDQQRPYQLSLPDEETTNVKPTNRSLKSPHSDEASSHFSAILAQQAGPNSAVTRLQPQIRHPDSPAGYPLPDETPFSPVVQGASDLPPPPPPKDVNRQGVVPDHSRQASGSSYLTSFDLNRSGTHRTAVSAVSGISDPPTQSPGGFSSTRRASLDRERGSANITGARAVSNMSTGPPSSIDTLSRVASPALSQSNGGEVKTTILEAPRRPSLDIYDASPLGASSSQMQPQNQTPTHKRTASRPETPKLSLQTPSSRPGSSRLQQQSRDQGAGSDRFVELEGTKADGFNMRIPRREQEEKIFYDAESGMRGGYGRDREEEYEGVTMSATSYPGQEWNPYGGGGWDDDSDVGVIPSTATRR